MGGHGLGCLRLITLGFALLTHRGCQTRMQARLWHPLRDQGSGPPKHGMPGAQVEIGRAHV